MQEKPNILKNHIGVVHFASVFFERIVREDILKEVFSNFYPFDIMHNKHEDRIEMKGYSSFFDELKADEPIPTYRMIFADANDTPKFFSMERLYDN
jgi:hypothetical protein